jgi:penicillin-binding protein 1A
MLGRLWQGWQLILGRYRWIRYSWYITLSSLSLLTILITYLWNFEVPTTTQLLNPDIKQASVVYDVKNRLIGEYRKEYRLPIRFEDINPYVKQGLLAVEDTRFYKHSGVDIIAMGRVVAKTIFMRDKASGGGSTLTQQLAKQLFPRPNTRKRNVVIRSLSLVKSKFKEWLIALKIEQIYSKDQIMTMYLNKFEFVNGAHGLEAAAWTYFGSSQKDLSVAQVATLIGMLQNPSLYNPIRFAEKTKERRDIVLAKMEEAYGLDLTVAKKSSLDMSCFERFSDDDGRIPYYQQALAKYTDQLIKDQKILKSDGTYYDIYSDGLRLETTIDLDMQKYAEEASKEHMIWLQEWFFKLWKDADPWTFQANSEQKEYRKFTLTQRIWATNRYKTIKKQYWKKIKDEWPTTLPYDDNMIEYLVNPSNKSNTITPAVIAILEKKPNLKSLVHNFQKEVDKVFSTEIDMLIYDPKAGTKKIKMSPMDSIRYHAMILQNAMVVMDPRNGDIKSWIGGVDFDYFKFDHATSTRAIGSTMKPFLYTVAMQKGLKPCTEYVDQEYSIAPHEGKFKNTELWAPHNATEIFTTLKYNMYHGLLYSKNSITVRLLKEIGSIEPLRDLLDQVGISKNTILSNGKKAVPEWPSVALGAVDINVLQLAAAYGTFANQGVYNEPVWIKTIKNKEGKIIYQSKPTLRQVIPKLYNAIMVDMLKNVVGGEFTMGLKSQNGGKTGTTNDQCDGWFCGFTPSLVATVWTGGDDKFIRFDNTDIGQGYYTARPVFEKFLKKLEADKTGLYDRKLSFAQAPEGFKELTNCAKIKTEPLPEFVRKKLNLVNLLEKKPVTTENIQKPIEVKKDSISTKKDNQ